MLVTAVVTKDELVRLVEAFTPLRLLIDERRGRSVVLGRPSLIELVPDRGLRLRGDARIAWDVAGVAIPVTIQRWQILLAPRVVTRGRARVVALEPRMEELDMKLVPGFLGDKIVMLIREGVSQNLERLGWDFGRALSRRLDLPPMVGPARVFELVATDASVAVTAAELRVSVTFDAAVERAPRPARPPKAVRPARPRPASAS